MITIIKLVPTGSKADWIARLLNPTGALNYSILAVFDQFLTNFCMYMYVYTVVEIKP